MQYWVHADWIIEPKLREESNQRSLALAFSHYKLRSWYQTDLHSSQDSDSYSYLTLSKFLNPSQLQFSYLESGNNDAWLVTQDQIQ